MISMISTVLIPSSSIKKARSIFRSFFILSSFSQRYFSLALFMFPEILFLGYVHVPVDTSSMLCAHYGVPPAGHGVFLNFIRISSELHRCRNDDDEQYNSKHDKHRKDHAYGSPVSLRSCASFPGLKCFLHFFFKHP